MKKGPLLNNNSRKFTTRDSLGIESVASSISRDLCPIVNTVTPRAFYWAFMVWIYYDFYKYSGIEEHSVDVFDKVYLKRQDYFFVLSQLLTQGVDQSNLVGKQNSQEDINKNPDGPYVFNAAYFVSRYGGMQYYNAGCLTMDYIRDFDFENNMRFPFPRLTAEGKKMALEFQNIIKNTEYYKHYRLNDEPVPKDVLIEYGKAINIGLNGFENCKESLRRHLFENPANHMLKCSADYVKFIYDHCDMSNADLSSYRDILFDAFSVKGRNKTLPPELREVANGWEIVVGRQYFTSGLEAIWKYMLEQIKLPLTKKEWIKYCIDNTDWDINIDNPVSTFLPKCNYDFKIREAMISDARHYTNPSKMVENGLKVILSMYNRFANRYDFGEESALLTKGNETSSISFEELINTVQNYMDKSIREFVVFVMDNWRIEQHRRTAFEKLMQGRDGFYFEEIDGSYSYKVGFEIDFQGIRLYQLSQVMKDLNML